MAQYNRSNNSTSTDSPVNRPSFIFESLTFNEAQIWVSLFTVECVVIIGANCLSILVFTGQKYRKKKSSLLLTNLAVSDLLVGCLATTFQVYSLGAPWFWTFDLPMALNVPLDMFTGFCSLFSLTVIALERMYATWYPIQYRILRAHTYVVVIAVTWLLAALVPCAVFLIPNNNLSRSAKNYVMAMLLCLSVFFIIFSYTAIGIKMSTQNIHQNQRQRRRRHVIQTLSLVTFLSLASWLPFQVIIMAFYFSEGKYSIPYIAILSTKFLQFGNSFVNSIVYYLRMPGFRSDLKRIVCSRIPRLHCPPRSDPRIQERSDNNEQDETKPANENGEQDNAIHSAFSIATDSTIFTEETKL
jgi:hypothetical protein